MYHRIVSGECPIPGGDPEEARYAVDLDEFRWQIRRIVRGGRRGVSVRMLQESFDRDGRVPPNWVVLTFDDGNLSDFVHALPILRESGFAATFFVGGDRLGAAGGVEPGMLSQMAAEGMDIGSHGMTHRFLTTLGAEDEEDELRRSKDLLERATGCEVMFYAPPGGRIGRRGVAKLRELSYRAVCTSVFGLNSCEVQKFEYRRMPVTATTTRELYADYVEAAAPRLVPLYVRDRLLRMARRTLGESGYRRLRSLGLGS
jgi:peptidoglycan/xylan/chitin deacetylase (PgdA/CDA1 family)